MITILELNFFLSIFQWILGLNFLFQLVGGLLTNEMTRTWAQIIKMKNNIKDTQ